MSSAGFDYGVRSAATDPSMVAIGPAEVIGSVESAVLVRIDGDWTQTLSAQRSPSVGNEEAMPLASTDHEEIQGLLARDTGIASTPRTSTDSSPASRPGRGFVGPLEQYTGMAVLREFGHWVAWRNEGHVRRIVLAWLIDGDGRHCAVDGVWRLARREFTFDGTPVAHPRVGKSLLISAIHASAPDSTDEDLLGRPKTTKLFARE